MGSAPRLREAATLELTTFCFRKCVNSFREKRLNPYERDCLRPCIESQVSLNVELHNALAQHREFQREGFKP